MFVDLAGSTALSAMLDPEACEQFLPIITACAEAIEARNGYVAKYMGDGVLAYFGYPSAGEDAVHAAPHFFYKAWISEFVPCARAHRPGRCRAAQIINKQRTGSASSRAVHEFKIYPEYLKHLGLGESEVYCLDKDHPDESSCKDPARAICRRLQAMASSTHTLTHVLQGPVERV